MEVEAHPQKKKPLARGEPSSGLFPTRDNEEITTAAQRFIDPAAGKQAAVSAYLHGVLSIDSCQRLFNRAPSWRAA
jgi:hypothetical protein